MDQAIQVSVLSYMQQLKEKSEMHPLMQDLQQILNPEMKYKLLEYIYWNQINSFRIFEHQEQNEIMYMAMLMQPKMNISNEWIIMQDDEAYVMYIILSGEVMVYINESKVESDFGRLFTVLRAKNNFTKKIKTIDEKIHEKKTELNTLKNEWRMSTI